MTKAETKGVSDREILLSRVLEAPRERVWKALTDPMQVDQWWGPNGFRNVTQSWDFRPGGLWKHVMIGPDGAEYPNVSRFVEIVENDHVTYFNSGSKKGEKGMSFHMTFSLKALGPAKTEVTIHHVFETKADRDFVVERFGAVEGGKQTLLRLAGYAAPGFELLMERVIDAPVSRVWDAWAKPDQVAQWFAPKPYVLIVRAMDLKAGGAFDMSMRAPDGQEHAFAGRYFEVVAGRRICWTGEFPGDPPGNMRTEVLFEAQGQKTKLKVRQTFAVITPVNEQPTKGAKIGWGMTLDQLDAFCGKR